MRRLENSTGLSTYLQGDFVEARRHLERALTTHRARADLNRIQMSLGNLSLIDVAEGNAAAARTRLRECLSINRRLQNLYRVSHFLPALAETFRMEGDAWEDAIALVGAGSRRLSLVDFLPLILKRANRQRWRSARGQGEACR